MVRNGRNAKKKAKGTRHVAKRMSTAISELIPVEMKQQIQKQIGGKK
ncbi:Uncharacterised protein [Mycobacteroides abscessus subsp. abscessus]|nr:Uncharacterised protein [Mycobacteroides abscessus subsp. abscessus]